jgi:hypothetical protein
LRIAWDYEIEQAIREAAYAVWESGGRPVLGSQRSDELLIGNSVVAAYVRGGCT